MPEVFCQSIPLFNEMCAIYICTYVLCSIVQSLRNRWFEERLKRKNSTVQVSKYVV